MSKIEVVDEKAKKAADKAADKAAKQQDKAADKDDAEEEDDDDDDDMPVSISHSRILSSSFLFLLLPRFLPVAFFFVPVLTIDCCVGGVV